MKLSEFKLERYFAEYEFSTPYTLCSSDCESFSIKDLLSLEEDSEEELKNLWLGYTESQGGLALRKDISGLYSKQTPGQTIVFSGAQEGIFTFMNALLEKNDHVIVQYPAYQSLFEVAKSIGCKVTCWTMNEDKNWELDLEFLKQNIRKNTKLIVLNSPNNPTGYSISAKSLNEIIEIARENNTYIFSDEVYRYLEYDEKNRSVSVCDLYDKGISLGVMSKSFGLAGLRIGWLCTKDNNLLEQIKLLKDFTTICNSAPSEFLASIAIKHKEFLLNRNLSIIKKNLNLLDRFFGKYPHLFRWVRPRAGPIAFPRVMFDEDVELFCKKVVETSGVLLLPSTKYDFENKHFRIGFGRRNMPEALQKLEEYVEKNL